MAAMDLKVGNDTIGMVLNYKQNFKSQKIVNTALDGTVYTQNTGRAIKRYEVYVFCATKEYRDDLDAAANDGAQVTMHLRDDSTETGYIEEDVAWREWVDGHGVGQFTLIVI